MSMDWWGYKKTDLTMDLSLILFSIFTTYLIGYTYYLQDPIFSFIFRFIIYLIDFSILVAGAVSLQARGALLVFYFFRVVNFVFSEDIGINQAVLPAIVMYVIFKMGCIWANRKVGLCYVDQDDRNRRDQFKNAEQKRRHYFWIILTTVSYLTIAIATRSHFYLLPTLLFLLSLICSSYQLSLLPNHQQHISRLLSNTLHYNIYILIAVNFTLAHFFHNNWLQYAEQIIGYLALTVLLLRVRVAIQSCKFHREDKTLMEVVYPFAHQNVSKRYNDVGRDRSQKVPKTIDKISRKIALIVYLLAATVAAEGKGSLWLLIGIILLNIYPIENDNQKPTSYLQEKLGIKLRLTLTFPLLVFGWHSSRSHKCHKDLIFAIVSGCDSYLNYQHLLTLSIAFSVVCSQLISDAKLKEKIQKSIAFIIPVLVVMAVIGLQCQNMAYLLLIGYTLALCFEIIRDDKMKIAKGDKKL